MNAKSLGMVCIILSLVFLFGSFLSPYMISDVSVPLAGLSIVFIIFSVLLFQQAEKSDMKTQWKLNSEIAKEIQKATSAIDTEERNERKATSEFKKEISFLASDMKRQDKALATGLVKQGKILSSDMKRQGKVSINLKKKVDTLASDVKKIKVPRKVKASGKNHKAKKVAHRAPHKQKKEGRRPKERRRQESPSGSNPPSGQRWAQEIK